MRDDDREALAAIIGKTWIADKDGCPLHLPDMVDAILAELRRRGAILPGDPVTEEMVEAACGAYDECFRIDIEAIRGPMRAALTAAINARKQP